MERFYYGMTGGGTDKRVNANQGGVPHILISAATLWLPKSRRFKKWEGPKHESLFIDSGGFSFHRDHGEYPFSMEEYVREARALAPQVVATLDYPCEPKVDRTSHETNRERIDLTVSNAIEATRNYRDLPWLPVIQGYTPEEYRDCITRMEATHTIRPYMGVGSLCTRTTRDTTWEVLRVVQRALPDVRLHGFGISYALLKGDPRIRRALWSADSQAWRFRTHISPTLGRKIWKFRTMAEQIANFPWYERKVNRLLTTPTPGLEAYA